jgi:tetratricopeptide (TPR) repeat protein
VSDTLPWAPVALRELAALWLRQLSDPGAPSELQELQSRLLHLYLQILNTDPDAAVRADAAERILSLYQASPEATTVLAGAAEIVREEGDAGVYRRMLELLATSDDADARRNALEKLGDLFEEAGNRRAAVESWKPAAMLVEAVPGEQQHARRLYERVLETLPDDGEAAERLVHIYASAGDWKRVPEVMGVVVRRNGDRGGELVLGLAARAIEAGAVDELATMVDEAVAWLGPSSPRVQGLQRAKARALADRPARHAEASDTFRAMLETFATDDDRRQYEAFIATLPADERHWHRRWLFQWRAARESPPTTPLIEWARAEEDGGQPEAAIAVYRRLAAVAHRGEGAALEPHLAAAVRGAVAFPGEIVLWEAAERVARAAGRVDDVARAYGRVLAERPIDAALAEALGRRAAVVEAESSVEPAFFVGLFSRVLDLAPRARWALDRVKLTLGSEGRFGELFRLYDRAIAATEAASERAELLDEAAFAARDLAGDVERAIQYLAAVHALRPDDAATSVALERLYERQGRKGDLVRVLAHRAARSDAATRRQLGYRVAALWLELESVTEASAVVEAMLDEGAPVADVTDLLERVARHPGQGRAIARLRAHYESVGRYDDAVRTAEAALEEAASSSPSERAARVRDLVRVRVSAARGAPGVFARVLAGFESEVAGKPALAQLVYRSLLRAAITAWKRPPTDADYEDAADGAWCAVDALKSVLLGGGDVERARRLLDRAAHLRFETGRRRELLHRAALLYSDAPNDRPRAIRLYGEIFADGGADAIAASSLERYAALLEAAGLHAKLASLWEGQARHRSAGGTDAEQGACWHRSAAAWERHESMDRAIAAYECAAALGSATAFDALARIYPARREWSAAVRVLEWLCGHAPQADRPGHAVRLADAYVETGAHDRARARLEQVLGAAKLEGAKGAGALGIGAAKLEAAADVEAQVRTRLMDIYRRDGVWEPLARMLTEEARRSGDRDEKIARLREAVEVLEEKLDRPAEAASVMKSLLALHSEPRSLERALLHQRLARALARSNAADEAIAHLRQAAVMQPAHPLILHELGRAALEGGQLDLAASTYRTLLLALRRPTAEGAAIPRVQVVLALSRIALLKGDPTRAAGMLDSALDDALDGGEPPEPFEKALREMGRHDIVARSLRRRVEGAGDATARAVTLANMAELWSEHLPHDAGLGDRVRHHAEAALRDLQREGGTDLAARSALLAVHVRLHDDAAILASEESLPRQDAARVYESILDGAPSDRATVRTLAQRLEALGSDRLVECLERWMAIDPEAAERAYEAVGDPERLSTLIAARAERATDAAQKTALWLRAAALLEGDAARALPLVERARSASPESIEAGLAWTRAKGGKVRPEELLGVLGEVAERNRGKRIPAMAGVYLELAKAHLATDDLAEAFDALKVGFSIDARRGDLSILLGLTAIDLDDEKTAERALMAVALAGARKEGSTGGADAAEQVTAYVHLASMAHTKGDDTKARRWISKAVGVDPRHAGARALAEKLATS